MICQLVAKIPFVRLPGAWWEAGSGKNQVWLKPSGVHSVGPAIGNVPSTYLPIAIWKFAGHVALKRSQARRPMMIKQLTLSQLGESTKSQWQGAGRKNYL